MLHLLGAWLNDPTYVEDVVRPLLAGNTIAQAATVRVHVEGLGLLGLVLVVGIWLWRKAGGEEAGVEFETRSGQLQRKTLIDPETIGTLVGSNAIAPQDVDVTVFAPSVVLPREEVIVQVILHTLDREAEAHARARKSDAAVEALASVPLTVKIRENDNVRISLECENAWSPEPVQATTWNGRLVHVYFALHMPPADARTFVRPKLRIFVNGVPAGQLIFKIEIRSSAPGVPPSPVGQSARVFRKPFLSYASEDRLQVLKAAQVLDALKMDYFQDILKLSPGDRWERRLYTEIETSDLFLLFWSRHAQQSEWVIREAEYALQHAKEAASEPPLEIIPILLEGPPPPQPPESLKDIHFNDPIRHIIFAEETAPRPASHRDPGRLDWLGRNVDLIFISERAKIAEMKDGRVLALVDGAFAWFESLEDYRAAHRDRSLWTEVTKPEQKRAFYQEAADVLTQIDGDAERQISHRVISLS
jgi:TIR domain-containing protein